MQRHFALLMVLATGPCVGFAAAHVASAADPARAAWLVPGDHTRTITLDQHKRTYLVHVPPQVDPKIPAAVVLALHGAAMDGSLMVWLSGLNKKSDEAGFVAVYPSGMGLGAFRTWNAGGLSGALAEGGADDVAFIGQVLDDLATVVKLDDRRVYACGMSNGGMMCYRLAAELSDRIAAIAPVAGTMAVEASEVQRPVPVIHFHGSDDLVVPFEIKPNTLPPFLKLKGVEESIQTWVKLNGCDAKPMVDTLASDQDDLKVTRQTYRGGRDGAEVVLIVIEGGGHTWPGQAPPVGGIGKSTQRVSANDLMWEFFQQHPLK